MYLCNYILSNVNNASASENRQVYFLLTNEHLIQSTFKLHDIYDN